MTEIETWCERGGMVEFKLRRHCTPYLANDTEAKDRQPPRSFRQTSGWLAKEIRAVDPAGADWIHVDVMDGRFSDASAQEAL